MTGFVLVSERLTFTLRCPAAPVCVIAAPHAGHLTAADRSVSGRTLEAHHAAHARPITGDQLQSPEHRRQRRSAPICVSTDQCCHAYNQFKDKTQVTSMTHPSGWVPSEQESDKNTTIMHSTPLHQLTTIINTFLFENIASVQIRVHNP